jgi:hypothetical protein
MNHSPYSPDLAPRGFHLIGRYGRKELWTDSDSLLEFGRAKENYEMSGKIEAQHKNQIETSGMRSVAASAVLLYTPAQLGAYESKKHCRNICGRKTRHAVPARSGFADERTLSD